jgi:tetratricopeptide (TPR) repeat protein
MKAYEFMLQGKSVRDSFGADDTARARRLFEKAIELDPRYARAHSYLADTYFVDLLLGLASEDTSRECFQLARKSAALDSNDIVCMDQLGFAYISEGMWEDAEVQFEKVNSLLVNEAEPMVWCGYALVMLGQPEKAQEMVLEAMRLDPLHPYSYEWVLGQAYYFGKRYEDANRVLKGEALSNSLGYGCLVGAYAYLGRIDEAHAALDSFLKERLGEFRSRNIVIEGDTINTLAGGYRRMWRQEEDWNHFADGLRKAGVRD